MNRVCWEETSGQDPKCSRSRRVTKPGGLGTMTRDRGTYLHRTQRKVSPPSPSDLRSAWDPQRSIFPPDLRTSSARLVHLRPDLPSGLNPIRLPFNPKDVPINSPFRTGSTWFGSAAVDNETVAARAKKKKRRVRSVRGRISVAKDVERRRASETIRHRNVRKTSRSGPGATRRKKAAKDAARNVLRQPTWWQ